MAAEQKSCNVVVFHAREANCFNLRVNNSATKHLDRCIETDIPVPAAAGFRCTTKYWPQCDARATKMRISVVITRTHDNLRRNVTGHIDLPSRTGLPVTQMTLVREPIPAGRDCEGGISLVAKRADLEAYCVTDDGHFTAVCMVSVSTWPAWPPPPLPTPSGLDHAILTMSDLTDVSFHVEGETFRAHRLVLAARSPVFKAELYGEMAEGDKASSVTIQEMRAPTFKSMLEYMYHGSLPAAAPDMDNASRKTEFQHLYVAADRYGLDTLKEMCEEVLCATVSVSTVLSNLVFAEEQTSGTCLKLKSRCLDFLAAGENFKQVAVTNEYVDIMKDAPSLLAQVQNWFKRPRLS